MKRLTQLFFYDYDGVLIVAVVVAMLLVVAGQGAVP